MSELDLQVVIPSRKRPNLVPRVLKLVPDALVCIQESEVDAYRKVMPDAQYLVHPDGFTAMGRKRQWILDNVPNDVVFMLDDDVRGLKVLTGLNQRKITNPADVLAVIAGTARCAKDVGTSVFGYAHTPDTRHFKAFRPFTFTGYVNGMSIGIVGRDVPFDVQQVAKADIDISLHCLWKKRILWRDLRYAFVSYGWFANAGGLAGHRTQEALKADAQRIHRKWGEDAVIINHDEKTRGEGLHQNICVRVRR